MKIGWLVYDGYSSKPEFWTTEPDSWLTFTRIVYCEVIEDAQG
jgi:hypothetical protein